MSYDDMKKPELQKLARERKLPTSGTNDELIARLEQYDNQQAQPADEPDLTALGDDPEQPAGEGTSAGPASDTDTSGAATPSEPSGVDSGEGTVGVPVRDRGGVFRTEFKLNGDLSDGIHQDYRRQVVEQAKAAGHRPVEGTAGARLVGVEARIDGQYAIYQIHTRQAF